MLCSFKERFQQLHCLFLCNFLKISFQSKISNGFFPFLPSFIFQTQVDFIRKIRVVILPFFYSKALAFFIVIIDAAIQKMRERDLYSISFLIFSFFFFGPCYLIEVDSIDGISAHNE